MRIRGTVTRPGNLAIICGWLALGSVASTGCSGDDRASCGTGGSLPKDAGQDDQGGQDAVGGEGGAAGGQAGQAGQAGAGGAGGVQRAVPAWVWTVNCPDAHEPTDPLDYGRCAIAQALAEAHSSAVVSIAIVGDPAVATVVADLQPLLDGRAESYVAATIAQTTWVIGRDALGAMYGALEIAERLRLNGGGALPLPSTLRAAPTLSTRAVNIFLTMPETGEKKWWFLDEQFWTSYLDLLAHSRLNLLDLHAMYDPNSTQFPNALLYLATAASTPDVGAPIADRERNLKMLNRIIAMAGARGVGIGLMTYQSNTSLDALNAGPIVDDPKDPNDGQPLKTYIKEATFDLATRAPGLAMLGFRIGETDYTADWYVDTFVAGAKQAGTSATLYTRTWQVPSKNDLVRLASAVGPNMVIEAKYNAEQWGLLIRSLAEPLPRWVAWRRTAIRTT